MADERTERRMAMLSDADIERIETAFDKQINTLFEKIGYDTTTPDTRKEIRKDHEFVRGARQAKGKVITAFFTGVGGSIALWFWAAIGKPPQ